MGRGAKIRKSQFLPYAPMFSSIFVRSWYTCYMILKGISIGGVGELGRRYIQLAERKAALAQSSRSSVCQDEYVPLSKNKPFLTSIASLLLILVSLVAIIFGVGLVFASVYTFFNGLAAGNVPKVWDLMTALIIGGVLIVVFWFFLRRVISMWGVEIYFSDRGVRILRFGRKREYPWAKLKTIDKTCIPGSFILRFPAANLYLSFTSYTNLFDMFRCIYRSDVPRDVKDRLRSMLKELGGKELVRRLKEGD